MNRPRAHVEPTTFLHGIPLGVVVALVIGLWRPVYDSATPTAEQEAKIADLAQLLASPSSTADAIDERLRSFGPFPPDVAASRTLAESLIACRTARLADSERMPLARTLYAITVQNDTNANTIPGALAQILQAATASRCDPATLDRLMNAARDVARADPNPRRDWW